MDKCKDLLNLKIKYATGEQKLMVTVDRCEALKKESGIFGGDHNGGDHYNDDENDHYNDDYDGNEDEDENDND